jgi:hypothetical protein
MCVTRVFGLLEQTVSEKPEQTYVWNQRVWGTRSDMCGALEQTICGTRMCGVEKTIFGEARADICVEPACVGCSRPPVGNQSRHMSVETACMGWSRPSGGNQSRHMSVEPACMGWSRPSVGTRAEICVEPARVEWSRSSVENQSRHLWETRADIFV